MIYSLESPRECSIDISSNGNDWILVESWGVCNPAFANVKGNFDNKNPG